MTDTHGGARIARLTNMVLAHKTLLELGAMDSNLPRFGLLYGPSGYGKTVAVAFAGQQFDAVSVEARSIWTKLDLLTAIAEKAGIVSPARTASKILAQVADVFNRDPRPLIIDEFDHVVSKGSMVEVVRDIHEETNVPILMVGEERLPQKLQDWERFHNRILVSTAAQPATEADGYALAKLYSPNVTIADDLVNHFVKCTRGVTRRITVNIVEAQQAALANGDSAIDLAWWGDRPVRTGEVATRRRAA